MINLILFIFRQCQADGSEMFAVTDYTGVTYLHLNQDTECTAWTKVQNEYNVHRPVPRTMLLKAILQHQIECFAPQHNTHFYTR